MQNFILVLCLLGSSALAQNQLSTPNVSGNALFLSRNSNFGDDALSTTRNGIDLQEAELAFFSAVDPYTKLSILLAVHPEYEDVGGTIEESFVFEPEELFAESNQVPGITLKVGKFKALFGKHNSLHAHVFPFIDAPLANSFLLGDEGLNDAGVSAAFLLPTSWYNELALQFLRGEGENSEFNSAKPGDGVSLAHWKNLVDLSDELTAEIGASWAQGRNSLDGITTLSGADLTFKFRPVVGGKYHSWVIASEYMQRDLEQPGSTSESGKGWSAWLKYQFAERWAALVRHDHFKASGVDTVINANALTSGLTDKYAAALTFAASEFSSYKLEYAFAHAPPNASGEKDERKILLQAGFTIGAHPTHTY